MQATTTVNGVTVAAKATVSVTGLSATSSVGAVTAKANADANVTGLQATTTVGSVFVWGNIVPDQNPSYSTIQPSQTPEWEQIAA